VRATGRRPLCSRRSRPCPRRPWPSTCQAPRRCRRALSPSSSARCAPAQGQEPSRIRVNAVRFTPDARTAWHSHAVVSWAVFLGLLLYRGIPPSRHGRPAIFRDPIALMPGRAISPLLSSVVRHHRRWGDVAEHARLTHARRSVGVYGLGLQRGLSVPLHALPGDPMALYAGPSDSARNRIAHSVSSARSGAAPPTPCLVCGRLATWRIERPDGSYGLRLVRLHHPGI
jgi:hypothetical protein